MRFINYSSIIKLAWSKFNGNKAIQKIEDISAKVSTNHVFRVSLQKNTFVIAKLSHFGRHDYFVEDHTIINTLANNLLYPFDQFLARSMTKNNETFTYRYQNAGIDVWVVFYNPIRIFNKLPNILELSQIEKLGEQLGYFHDACQDLVDELPASSKTMRSDIQDFLDYLETPKGKREHSVYEKEIRKQCQLFLENSKALEIHKQTKLPIFIDWNIGNFSVDNNLNFYSRWDYDWFRMSPRALDFYFWSRVVRADGDQTIFSYTVSPFNEDRFSLFLKSYHAVYPLTEKDILLMKEAYRFFILHYIVKLGHYFFLNHYAIQLVEEAFQIYFKEIDNFDSEKLLKILS